MAALSSSSAGAFRSPADLQEGVLLKQLKVTQFMNSAGFNQNVLKMAAENKMLVTPYTEGIYNFILQSGRGNILPLEFISMEDLEKMDPASQFYVAFSIVQFVPTLDRFVFSNRARMQISMMDSKTFETFATAIEDLEVDVKLLVHRRAVLTGDMEDAPRSPTKKQPLFEQVKILTRLFLLKESLQNHAIYSRVASVFQESAFFQASVAAEGESDPAVRQEFIRTNAVLQTSLNFGFSKWKRFIQSSKYRIKARAAGSTAVEDEETLNFNIYKLEVKAASLLEPSSRRASTFGSLVGGGGKISLTFGGLAPKDRHQNTAALLSDLASEGLQRQAAQTLEHSGSDTTKAVLSEDMLCDELRHFLQAYEVGSAAWTKALCTILKASGTAHLEQLASSWRTKDLIVLDAMNFTTKFGIKESACVLFRMISQNLDVVSTDIQVSAVITKMCALRLSPQVEQDEYAIMAKELTASLNIIEIDLASKVTLADSLKVIMTLCTNINPTGSGTAQLKRDQRALLIEKVEHTKSLREAISLMSLWHSKDVTANAQNRVFAALSAPQTSVKGRPTRYDESNFTGIDTLMLVGQAKDAKDGAGGAGGARRSAICFINLRHANRVDSQPCSRGAACRFSHETTLTQPERNAFTCKQCGKFLCNGARPSKFASCEHKVPAKSPQKQSVQNKQVTVAYAGLDVPLSSEEVAMLSQAFSSGTKATKDYQRHGKGGKGKGRGKGGQMQQAVLMLGSQPQHLAAAEELSLASAQPKQAQAQAIAQTPRQQMLSILSARAAQAGAIEAHGGGGRPLN